VAEDPIPLWLVLWRFQGCLIAARYSIGRALPALVRMSKQDGDGNRGHVCRKLRFEIKCLASLAVTDGIKCTPASWPQRVFQHKNTSFLRRGAIRGAPSAKEGGTYTNLKLSVKERKNLDPS
jgi:hypothetical protein